MNELALTFEDHPFRIIWKDGKEWFVLPDLCEMLDIANSRDAAARLDKDEKDVVITDTLGGPQQTTIISEPGLYKLLQSSRKPIAKRFDRRVRHEILPEVRRTGSYRGNISLNALFDVQAALRRDVGDIGKAVNRTEAAAYRMEGNVIQLMRSNERIEQRINDRIPRKDAPEKSHRIYIYTIHKCFDGLCPCGCKTRLLDKYGQPLLDEHGPLLVEDHWYSRERNGIECMWIVFRDCNQKMKDDDYRRSKHSRFVVFHEERKSVQHRVAAPKKPKKGKTPTIPDRRQSDMFK